MRELWSYLTTNTPERNVLLIRVWLAVLLFLVANFLAFAMTFLGIHFLARVSITMYVMFPLGLITKLLADLLD